MPVKRQGLWLLLVLITSVLCIVMSTVSKADGLSAAALVQQGKQFYLIGKFDQALVSWQQAEKAYIQANDPRGIAGSLINQAKALEGMGLQRQSCKVLVQALKVDEQICEIGNQAVTVVPQQDDHTLILNGLQSLGEVLRLIGNLEASQAVLQQTWKLAQQTPTSDMHSSILLNLGNTAKDLGDRDLNRRGVLRLTPDTTTLRCDSQPNIAQKDANAFYLQAIACYQQAASSSASTLVSLQARLNQLKLLVSMQQWLQDNGQRQITQEWLVRSRLQASELIHQIKTQNLQHPLSYESIAAHINFADSLITTNNLEINEGITKFDDIQQLLETSIQQAKQINHRSLEIYAIGNLGRLHEQAKKLTEALKLTEQALQLASSIHAQDSLFQWQWQRGRILTKLGKQQAAIAAYEQSIAILKEVRKDLTSVRPDAQFSLRDNVEPVYRELVDLLLIEEQPSQENLQQAIQLFDNLQLAELEDFFRCELRAAKSIRVEQVEDPAAAIFYPIILSDRLEIILKLPHTPQLAHYRTAVSRIELEAQLNQLRQQLESIDSEQDHQITSKKIYDWMIRQAEGYLDPKAIKTLVFVADSSLRSIPLAAIFDSQHYLIENYAVAVTPGLEILGPKHPPANQLGALLVGLGIERKLEVQGQTRRFAPLEHVQGELEQIKTLLPHSEELLDQQFTTTKFRERVTASSYPIVHVATHGQFSSDPDATFLLTASPQPVNTNELQSLLHDRAQGGVVPIELLVLSACETATGDKRAALGLAGVAVRAGALGTIASLWAAKDASTALLMTQFYQALSQPQGLTKSQALQQAQKSFLRSDSPYNHPRYWAPFVLIGNWL
ncbi:MAG: CHAT domain-containing protein [Pantanalinema sp. GBBB05]|nr:CHAT domain-containing protein [Pantanalinema sp. GBBB05]